MDDIKSINKEHIIKSTNHYINHISVCPYAEIVMFFHLWENNEGRLFNRVFLMDYRGCILNVINDFDRASHYAWKNSKQLLLTVIIKEKCEYRLYDIETGISHTYEHLKSDGHPSYINDEQFITDTYPDHAGMQHVYLCSADRILCELVSVYHNPRKVGIYRCDLHPRYSLGTLSFDSVIRNERCQYVLDIRLVD